MVPMAIINQRSQRDDSRIQKERNKANDFTCKLQYDVSTFFLPQTVRFYEMSTHD